ncbi:MAG: hypothetical protein AAFV86_15725 [Pseudomonadota bacterium]
MVALKDRRLPAAVVASDAPDWTAALTTITPAAAETLAAAAHTLCPHDALPPRCYRRVALMIDRDAAAAPALAARIAEAAAALDAHQPLPFVDLSEGGRAAALRAIESTMAFHALHRGTIRHLYDDREVWQALGYEGASFDLGGYRTRGFDDLDWLPDPPRAACEG